MNILTFSVVQFEQFSSFPFISRPNEPYPFEAFHIRSRRKGIDVEIEKKLMRVRKMQKDERK